ncbi:ABC transporter ATP-binding protein [Cellulomonas sp. P22]|uniref:ABC transporter ATP-binding protein n=1 Tax=Cellulomonas sp. P22 TaxID=3373189 RepID=UPI003791A393
MSAAVEFSAVSVDRRGRRLVDSVTFAVPAGTVHALLGHNGAGKTTLMRALSGLVPVASGSIRTSSEPSVLFVGTRLPGDLAVAQILEHRRRLLGSAPSAVATAVEHTGIAPFIDRRAGALSTGMIQRVAIATALMADAQTIVLDEPTTGLDPQGVDALLTLIHGLRDEGRTVIICSHDLAQLELVCDGVTCLRDGQLTAHGTVRDVADDLPAPGHVLRTSDDAQATKMLLAAGIDSTATARGIQVGPTATLSTVLSILVDQVEVTEATVDHGLFARIYAKFASAPERGRPRRRGRA